MVHRVVVKHPAKVAANVPLSVDRVEKASSLDVLNEQANIFKLLAIDDDPQTLSLIADALGDEGLEILTAEDPEAGFQMFQSLRPRVVLLDLLMPGVSGMDMLNASSALTPVRT